MKTSTQGLKDPHPDLVRLSISGRSVIADEVSMGYRQQNGRIILPIGSIHIDVSREVDKDSHIPEQRVIHLNRAPAEAHASAGHDCCLSLQVHTRTHDFTLDRCIILPVKVPG